MQFSAFRHAALLSLRCCMSSPSFHGVFFSLCHTASLSPRCFMSSPSFPGVFFSLCYTASLSPRCFVSSAHPVPFPAFSLPPYPDFRDMPFLRIRYPSFPALRAAPPCAPCSACAPHHTHLHLPHRRNLRSPHIVSCFTGTNRDNAASACARWTSACPVTSLCVWIIGRLSLSLPANQNPLR